MIQENSKFDALKNSTLENVKQRFSDPLIGNYLITFCIYNWKIFFYAFSNYSTEEKINLIENTISSNISNTLNYFEIGKSIFYHPFIFPFLITLFYIFLYPKLTSKVRQTFLDFNVLKRNETYDADSKLTPIKQKIQNLEDRLANETNKNNMLSESARDKDQVIELLKKDRNQLENNIKALSLDYHNLSNDKLQVEEKLNKANNSIDDLNKALNDVNIKYQFLLENKKNQSSFSILNELEKKQNSIIHSNDFNKEKFRKIASDISNSNLRGEPTSASDPRMHIAKYANLGLVNKDLNGNWTLTDLGKLVLNKI